MNQPLPPSPPAPVDPRQLLLPSLQGLADDLTRMLPPTPGMGAVQVRHMLVQMGQAAQVLNMHGLQQHLKSMEQALAHLQQELADAAALATTGQLLQTAAHAVQQYLQQPHGAAPHTAQLLFTSYRALTQVCGKDTAHPADLWEAPWPWPHALPAPEGVNPLSPSVALRAVWDQHTLALLQHSDLQACATLCTTSLGLAAHAPESSVWQVSAAWMEALCAQLLPLDLYAKRLASRLLHHYASFAKGKTQPPELLTRDLLFFCAQAHHTAHAQGMSLPPTLSALHAHCHPAPASNDAIQPTPTDADCSADPAITPPPLAPALPEFAHATEIDTAHSLGQGLANAPSVQPDHDFLQAAETLSQALEHNLQAWNAHPDSQLDAQAADQAHALARHAWSSGCTEIASLAHALQRCLQRMPAAATPAQRLCCQHASHEVQRLLHQFAAGFVRRAHPQVLDALQQLYAQLPEPEDASEQPHNTTPMALPPTPPTGAVVVAPAPSDALSAQVLDPLHFGVFEEEVLGLWPQLHSSLQQWIHMPEDTGARRQLLRKLHTLKGSARLAGAHALASQVHALESRTLELQPPQQSPATLQAPVEALRLAFVALQHEMANHHPSRSQDPLQQQPLHTLQRHTQALWKTQDAVQQANSASQLDMGALHNSLHKLRAQIQDCTAWADTLVLHGALDLPYEWHDELHALLQNLQLCADDAGTVHQQLQHHLGDAQDALHTQAAHLRAMQHTLLRARLRPLSHWQDRLEQCVRQACADTGKEATLRWEQADALLDETTAPALIAALEHLLRNCIAHGLESPEQRLRAGKSQTGTLCLRAHTQGAAQVLTLQDDGQGLDIAAIAQRAHELELVSDHAPVDAALAAQLILHPGLSTASTVTELAGRGIGMDVVADTLQQLGGQLHITTQTGQGCSFALQLPAPPHIEQMLTVRAAHWQVGLPTHSIESVRRVPSDLLEAALELGIYTPDTGGPLPVYWAGSVWQQTHQRPGSTLDGMRTLIVVRSHTARWALVADSCSEAQEVCLQALPTTTTTITGLLGMATLVNGHVVQVYDPVAVLQAHESRAPDTPPETADALEPAQQPLVLIADDSLSVRRLGQHLLQSQGYRVVTAEDGLQALHILDSEELPALVIADIEMPNLDGLQLLQRLRSDDRYQQLPVLMLTAHSTGPLSQQALDAGAQAFLTKPYTPTELLGYTRRFAKHTAAASLR